MRFNNSLLDVRPPIGCLLSCTQVTNLRRGGTNKEAHCATAQTISAAPPRVYIGGGSTPRPAWLMGGWLPTS